MADPGPASERGPSAARLATADQVSWGDGRRRWLLGLAAVTLVVVASWAAIRRGPEPGSAGGEADTPTTVATTLAPTTLLDGGPSGIGIAVQDEVARLVAPAPGLHLYLGHPDGVIDLDLDAGTQRRLPIGGRPVVLVGSWLVAVDPDDQSVAAVDLGSGAVAAIDGARALARTPQPGLARAADADLATEAAGRGPFVWLQAADGAGAAGWLLIDLGPGEVVDLVPAPTRAMTYPPGPRIVTSSAGGVFARVGGAYERVLDGALVAVAPDKALVRSCTGPVACQLDWYDTFTWERVDGAVPSVPIDADGAVVSADGSLLAFTSTDGELYLLDTGSGRRLLLPGGTHPITLTADGAYAAAGDEGAVILTSVADGDVVTIELTETPALGLLLGWPGEAG